MPAKPKKLPFVCTACGCSLPQKVGRCPECSEWNTITEVVVTHGVQLEKAVNLTSYVTSNPNRITSEHPEFDRVVGGGLLPGSVTLVGGDPGIGKSTLMLSLASDLANNYSCIYASGEESVAQVASRAKRMGTCDDTLLFMSTNSLEAIIQEAKTCKASIVIIDSIQTITTQESPSGVGTVAQVRECANRIVRYAKEHACTILIVGHVTKDGMLAGPRVLEHLVDTVLQFEGNDQSHHRLLRAIKNRFGSVHELGVFSMTPQGISDVTNPSELFLGTRETSRCGAAPTAIQNGRRILLVELQALVDTTYGEYPKRHGQGVDASRLPMLLAVLHRFAGLSLVGYDVYVNAVGGVTVSECASDAALVAALLSAHNRIAIPANTVFCGEIGLLGEMRPIPALEERLQEASQHGFTKAYVPHSQCNSMNKQPRIKIEGLQTIEELAQIVTEN